jgi:hypothetical protein
MPSTGTYYINTLNFSTATAVWVNSSLTTKAPDGYYVFNGEYRQQVNGLLQTLTSCNTGYKIRSFTSGQNINQTTCDGATYYVSFTSITVQLVGNDGVTPRVNNTGQNITVDLLINERGCFGLDDYYTVTGTILPGESEFITGNETDVNDCGGRGCVETSRTIVCYSNITPSFVEPTSQFFPLCTPTTYYNTQQSGTATRDNCPPGFTPSTVTLTVPADTYSSLISVEDANNQAIAYINANKQAYANANGTCTDVTYSYYGFYYYEDPCSGGTAVYYGSNGRWYRSGDGLNFTDITFEFGTTFGFEDPPFYIYFLYTFQANSPNPLYFGDVYSNCQV